MTRSRERGVPLSGLLPEELNELLESKNDYRGRQIFRWLQSGVPFESMSNLPLTLRRRLAARHRAVGSTLVGRHPDEDGSLKCRIRLQDGSLIEAVVLEDQKGRRTACLSTQVGCGMRCAFCGTARMGLRRSLHAHEIVEQLLLLRREANAVSNIVFMGMGEPLQNLRELRRSVEILSHPEGCAISLRRMTVSTCGIVAGILDLAENGPPLRLAVSVVTADPDLRSRLMPGAQANSTLPALKTALLAYQRAARKRVTLEIVLLAGINDRPRDARLLAEFIPPLRVMVNLLPWNPVPGLPFRRPSRAAVERFAQGLHERGIRSTQRHRRGGKIGAACGQLCVLQDRADPPHTGG
jgi:23S rRNA (adenine2503-C2)-methyltransferase